MTQTLLTKRQARWLIFFLGFINALTPFTIDLYLPAFSDIAADLQTSVAKVSLSIATYFVGFAVGQLIYGPLLDRFGRKPPLYAGLFVYVIATVGCMTAQSIEALWFFRCLSALGGSAASVGAVAMVRDFFDPKEAARVFSMLMLVLSVSPLFAPTVGGWIAEYFGWRAVFAALTGLALVDFVIVVFGLPSVFRGDKTVNLMPIPLLKSFGEILRVPQFRSYVLTGALSFSGLFVYLSGSPDIFIDGFQLSKQQYGYVFALLASAMIMGGQLNNLFLKRSTSSRILHYSISVQAVLSLLFLAVHLFTSLGLLGAIGFFFFILGAVGIGSPNASAMAIAPFEKNAGRAASLMGFMQMSLGALFASLTGVMNLKGTLPTALIMAISASLAWGVLRLGQKRGH